MKKFVLLAFILYSSLACNTLVPGRSSMPTLTSATAESIPPQISASPTPSPAESTPQKGASRSAPVPYGESANALDLSFRVIETLQGEQAWRELEHANAYNSPAPDGYTWLLIHLQISNYGNREISDAIANFMVTGSLGHAYFYEGAVPPAPELPKTLAVSETADGWAPYLVSKADDNLLVFYNPLGDSPSVYLALSPGAAVPKSDVGSVAPTDLGSRPEAPAPPGTTVTTQNWQLRVDEARRGDAAWQAVQQANPYNDPPADGREYLAVHMTVRALHTDETYRTLLASRITCLDGDTVYEQASVVPPHPNITRSRLFPGATDDGWLVFDVAQGADCTLRYEALFDYQNIYTRYLALP